MVNLLDSVKILNKPIKSLVGISQGPGRDVEKGPGRRGVQVLVGEDGDSTGRWEDYPSGAGTSTGGWRSGGLSVHRQLQAEGGTDQQENRKSRKIIQIEGRLV